ncbi:hypothetical protein Q8F55_005891 [Vanrija albida]|uniref:Extracellular membrane protein CFEM domain-containing protein n=1 Tax=Vanrija albida TaxID=181172 RepID=A0ABR3Q3F9_9TREE
MLFAVAALALATLASAQSAPDWQLIPKNCATQCASTIETSFLCNQQYQGGTAVYSCFCQAYPTDAAGCASCLTSNNAAALGSLLSSTTADCAAQQKSCAFACAFETCASSDIACQCSATYLENIFNCASCNSANNNAQGTKLADFDALNKSCGAQSFSGANQQFLTFVQSPTGQAGYQAPTLTATGGGEAATGTFQAATGKIPNTTQPAGGASSAPAPSGGAASSGAAAASSSHAAGSSSKPAASGSVAASASGSAAASPKPSSAANAVVAPAAMAVAVAVAVAAF